MNDTFLDLLAGNAQHASEFRDRFDEVQESQHPDAVTVCCADSRVLQDSMWGNEEPGYLFSVGNIGNRVVQRTAEGEAVSGDVLYPIAHAGTETAVIVGHTGCGAVTATYDAMTGEMTDGPGIGHSIGLLKPHLRPGVEALPADVDRKGAINRLVEYNVDRQVEFLLDSADVPEDIDVFGAVYDFQDVYSGDRGEVHLINVAGETDVAVLREEYPDIEGRIERLWEY